MIDAVKNFLKWEAAGGVVITVSAILALILANSPLAEHYQNIFEAKLIVKYGQFGLEKPLLLWINDGLMAIFFLLVGLELKREFLTGELSDTKQRLLPGFAALGGMIVPAILYLAFNLGDAQRMQGWAIPTATDIAFALGVLSLLGNRVPMSLKLFLVSLAILDDIGAICIIAIFYTPNLSFFALLLAAFFVSVLFIMNRRGVSTVSPYVLVGAFLWLCVLKSGVHATLSGVVLAFFIPIKTNHDQALSPLRQLEEDLHLGVAFFILPLFAFANAGVPIDFAHLGREMDPVSMGVLTGLLLGKPIGILLFSALAIWFFKLSLPAGVNWKVFTGVAILCGIGFTMSLFITTLAFDDYRLAVNSRLAILLASTVAAILGYLLLKFNLKSNRSL